MNRNGGLPARIARGSARSTCVRRSTPLGEIEGVVLRARRMVRWNVERFEVVELVLDLRTVRDIEAHAAEDALDALERARHGMQRARRLTAAGKRHIERLCGELGVER